MDDTIVYVDTDDGLKRVMNNKKLYVKLLNKFINETYLNDLAAALDAKDLDKAQIAAHTIKGVAANLSLVELQKQALEVETQVKNKSVEPGALESFTNCYQTTLSEVDKVIKQYDGG